MAAAPVRTILYAAVITDERWSALALPKPVADTVANAGVSSGARFLVKLVAEVLVAIRVYVMGKPAVAAMLTGLSAVEGIPLAKRSRARGVRAVPAVVAFMTLAEAELAIAVVAAIVVAVLEPELPHVAEGLHVEWCCRCRAASSARSESPEDDDGLHLRAVYGAVHTAVHG